MHSLDDRERAIMQVHNICKILYLEFDILINCF